MYSQCCGSGSQYQHLTPCPMLTLVDCLSCRKKANMYLNKSSSVSDFISFPAHKHYTLFNKGCPIFSWQLIIAWYAWPDFFQTLKFCMIQLFGRKNTDFLGIDMSNTPENILCVFPERRIHKAGNLIKLGISAQSVLIPQCLPSPTSHK